MQRFVLPLCLCLTTACTMEEQIIPDNSATSANSVKPETRVDFSLMIASQMQVQTRAPLSEQDENRILSVHVLMFKETAGVMTYYFGVTKTNILTIDPARKSFDVTLPTGVYDVIILANAQEISGQANIAAGDTKEKVLKALVEKNTGKWNRNNIPMWGQIDQLNIDAEAGFGVNNTVEMMRMAAKIDLEVDPSVANDFSLASVRLYNYSSQGTLVPGANNRTADNKVVAPTQPEATGGYAPVHTPQVFDATNGVTPDGCRQMIYVYEAPAGNSANLSTNTCLVVGGSYKGGDVTYYRIDFTGMENGQRCTCPCYAIIIIR